MKKSTKIGIYLSAIVLGLIISPAVALNQVDAAKNSVKLTEKISTSDTVNYVRMIGFEDLSFAPNNIEVKRGETILFQNVDGSKGGTDHSVISVKLGTREHDGKFNSGIIRVGETYRLTLHESGVYEFYDSLHPTIPGRISVS